MTRKDYIRFAAMLKHIRPHWKDNECLDDVANRMCAIFKADNARFDRAKFLKACGGDL
jgi:hypothetical protein